MKRLITPSRVFIIFTMAATLASGMSTRTAAAQVEIDMEVDARELPRSLLHARLTIPAAATATALWFPKWIPGIHGPRGPVENVGGLRVELPDGKPVPWKRDREELFRVVCEVPEEIDSSLNVRLDYICNQPSVNSNSIDSFGNSLAGIINWNTCLVYPEGATSDEVLVRLRLLLPPGWKYATSLETSSVDDDGWIQFEPVSLHDLIDSPLICGEHFRTIPLAGGDRPVSLHLTSESPAAIALDEEMIDKHRRLVAESLALFGAAHYDEYHFLVTCSETLGRRGLEHLSSSLNGVGERSLVDEAKFKVGPVYLLPHEYVHSWCGKYRRPAGMATPNFHQTKQTELLWIYEGLTQYLGELLAVRAGFLTPEEHTEQLAVKINRLMRQAGRGWRPLEDTAVAAWQLRGRSPRWGNLRRGQDYYNEGLLFWLEADAIIRTESDGTHSLDDFCARFLGQPHSAAKVVPFDVAEVIGHLSSLADYDWEGLIRRRIETAHDELSLDFVGLCGYRLEYRTEPSAYLDAIQRERKFVSAVDSVGLLVSHEGQVRTVVPGMAGDRAGLAPGMQIFGVAGSKFSPRRFEDAIADSIAERQIELLILDGERYRTVALDYDEGPKHLSLARDESRPDRLSEMLKPRAVDKK